MSEQAGQVPFNPYGGVAIPTAGVTPTAGRYCIRCAYALDGLDSGVQCPECGTAIELSLKEPVLANADPAYLATIRSGLSFVLNGILLTIIVAFSSIPIAMLLGGSRAPLLLMQGLLVAASAVVMIGYWKYTAPDPSQVAFEGHNSARSVIRVVVVIQAAIAALDLGIELMGPSIFPAPAPNAQPGTGAWPPMTEVISGLLTVCAFILQAVQFFAVMRYTRWVATRVPDLFIVKRTKRYMWLLPVLYVPGFAILIGPLIALILYWNLLDRLRKQVKSIIRTGAPRPLKGAMPV